MAGETVVHGPPRAITGFGAIAIVAGSMLGVGIFLLPRLVAEQVPQTAWFLGLWVFGGVVAVAGATAYGELGTMFPLAGGDYVYLRRAFGPSLGFAAGGLLFFGVFGGSIASMSVAVCQYQLPTLLAPWDLDLEAVWVQLPWEGAAMTGTEVAAVVLVLLLTALNAGGVRPTARVQAVVTLVPVGLLTLFALLCLARMPHASAVPAAAEALARPISTGGLAVAVLNIYFAYAGWNSVAYVGGEVRRPERNIPLGLLAGTGLVTAVYFLLCAAFVAVLGMGGLARTFEAGTAAATAVLGRGAAPLVAGIIAVALIGSINATVLGGARIAYAMGRDRLLPAFLSQLGRTRVPTRALWMQALLGIALIVTGTFELLVQLTSVAMLVLGGLGVLALFRLRRSMPAHPRPYRASGYPWLPALYLLTSILVIVLKVQSVWVDEGGAMRWFPLLGLAVFLLLWAGRRLTLFAAGSPRA